MKTYNSIAMRTFLISIIAMLILISMILVVQITFVNRIYTDEKINTIISNINKFHNEYNNNNWTEKEIEKNIKKFNSINNAYIVIDDIENQVISNPLTINEETSITKNVVKKEDNYINRYIEKHDVHYRIIKKYNGINELQLVKFINKDENAGRAMITIASLQPVTEAVTIIKDLYGIFYLIAVFFSVLIAYFYSRLVSRPLSKLTQVADKMANMNFDERAELTRKDELGMLSDSLNTLSGNLDNALSDLKKANHQLIIDMEKEKQQEQVRKEFVANVSHELKTPLGIIKGYAEGIKDGIKQEKADYYIDVILDEIQRMNRLILDMLELSRIEGNQVREEEVFNIKPIIEKTINVLRYHSRSKGMNVQVAGEFTDIKAVKFQIEQVIVNLLSNAIKYGEDNSNIIISGRLDNNHNYIYVYNEGEQFTQEELENIWLRFYKIDKSHNRQSGGTGLGLAIVKAILDGHGSDYGVENYEDGVRFYFSLDKI